MGRSSAPPINGEVVRQARLRKRLSQHELGQLCATHGYALDQGSISRIESGHIKWPSPRSLPPLAAALGLKVDDLLSPAEDDACKASA